MQPQFTAYISDHNGHPCYVQLTPVKTRYPLTSIMWPYCRLRFDRWPGNGFQLFFSCLWVWINITQQKAKHAQTFSIVAMYTDFFLRLLRGGIFPRLAAYSSTKKPSSTANWVKDLTCSFFNSEAIKTCISVWQATFLPLMLGATLWWTSIPSRGGVEILPLASCYRTGLSFGLMGHLARMQTLPFYPRKTSFLRFTVKSATSDKTDNHWPFLAFNSLLLRLTKIVLFKKETGDPGEKPPFGQHTVYGLLAVELSEEYHLVLLYLLITSI